MAQTEVLLLEKISNLGNEGDLVKVKSGFARNFLFPQRKAILKNRSNKKYIEALLKKRTAREAKELEDCQLLAGQIQAVSLAFPVKTASGGKKIYGSVTANHIIERLEQEGIKINKKQLLLMSPAKTLGEHSATIKLHPEVSFELSFEVVSENPIQSNQEEQ